MSKHNLFSLLLVVWLTAGMSCSASEESLHHQIRQWIQQLGDESFLVRQRAETLLIRAGIHAYPELQHAKRNPDIEIVRRAEYILSQIEQVFLDMENRETASWIQLYMLDPNPAFKARIIWGFADPGLDFSKGEGLQTLCRFARFEENSALRIEAVKSLIASPPVAPAARQKWYQYLRDNLHESDEDELLQCAARYAKLWCDLDDAVGKTTPQTTPEFQERTRQVGAETLRLLERPENNIQSGSKIDILLHYAVAELQEAAGLTADRDKTVSIALAIESGPIQTLEPIMSVGLEDDWLMNEHYHVGWNLKQQYRLRWAIAHFQKVMKTGDVSLRIMASNRAAESALLLADYPSAIAFYDNLIEILRGPDHLRNDAESVIAQVQRRKAYCFAVQAAEEKNWESVREILMQAWVDESEMPGNRETWNDGGDIDLLIVAHHLCKQQPGIDNEFKDMMNSRFKKTWNGIIADYDNTTLEARPVKLVLVCNIAAWLLANTGGDYQSALTLIEAALKAEPDDISFLDTLAHVYFLGGKIDDAIRIQEQVIRFAPEAVIFQQALERFKQGK